MKKRIWELDFLRGFSIIMMVFDHLMYDFMYMPKLFSNFHAVDNSVFNFLRILATNYWKSELRFFGHLFFVSVFLIVSGISYTFSKNNLSRGLKLLLLSLIITAVSLGLDFFLSDTLIVFGIIHLYATSILIIYLLRKFIKNELVLLIIAFIIIGIGFPLGFYDIEYYDTFEWKNLPAIIIGVKAFGSDYFSIFPYTGVILLGTVLGKIYYSNKVSLIPQVKMTEKNIFIFAGQKSLIIFITHQAFLLAFVYLIGYILGYHY